MELSKLFLNTINFKSDMSNQLVTSKQASAAKPGESFGSHLENSKKDYSMKKRQNSTKENKSTNQKKQKTNIQEPSVNTQQNSQKSKIKKNDTFSKTETIDYDTMQDQITQELSDELGLPESQITEILNQLNFIPIDLVDPENLNKFVQQLLCAEDPFELLTMPNVIETYNAVNSVIDKFKESGIDLTTETVEELSILSDVTPIIQDVIINPKEEHTPQNTDVEENVDRLPTIHTSDQAEAASSDNTTQNSFANNNFSNSNNFFSTSTETETIIENFVQTITSADNTIEQEKVVLTKESQSTDTSSTNVINQIIDRIKIAFKPGLTEMELTLKPEELGNIQLKISTENGVVTAQFMAESQRVKEIIESNINVLRDMLQSQGINVSELSVNVNADSSEGKMSQFYHGQQKSRRRIEQILNKIDSIDELDEEKVTGGLNYVNPQEVYDSNVDYSA